MLKTSQVMDLSYNTVYKWWNLTEEDFNSFEAEHEFMLDNYRQYFIEQLKITPQMNNTLLFKRLKTDFGDIGVPESTFQRYIKNLREQTGLVKPKRQFVLSDDPYPGYEAQADFGQCRPDRKSACRCKPQRKNIIRHSLPEIFGGECLFLCSMVEMFTFMVYNKLSY